MTISRRTVFGLALTLGAGSATRAPAADKIKLGDLEIGAAWVRQPPAGGRVAGGYLTITNTGKAADTLVSGSAPFAKRFEVHEMAMDGGTMRMRELPKGLAIKPGQTVELKPGGYHLMLLDLTEAPVAGKPAVVRLRFTVAGEVDVPFDVRPIDPAGPKGAKHSH